MHNVIRFTFLTLCLLNSPSRADEYFGTFLDQLSGEFIEHDSRPIFKLSSQFRFHDPNGLEWRVPPSVKVDGASIPQPFWSFIGGPFSGPYVNASVVHDYFCEVKVRTAYDTHKNFYYGMLASDVKMWKAKFMFWVVRTFGEDWKTEETVVHRYSCSENRSPFSCSQVSKLEEMPTIQPDVDLASPRTLALALSKASAIAKTLEATNGQYLDLSSSGPVSASLSNIENNARTYRDLFVEETYIHNPGELGVLSIWQQNMTEPAFSWSPTKLPNFSDTLIFGKETIDAIVGGDLFPA